MSVLQTSLILRLRVNFDKPIQLYLKAENLNVLVH